MPSKHGLAAGGARGPQVSSFEQTLGDAWCAAHPGGGPAPSKLKDVLRDRAIADLLGPDAVPIARPACMGPCPAYTHTVLHGPWSSA